MSFSTRQTLHMVLATTVLAGLLSPAGSVSGQDKGGFKLEGAWVARVTSVDGIPPGTPLPFQWSYVLAPSPSGRGASLHGSIDVSFPPTPGMPAGDFVTPIIGEAVQTGPDTATVSSIWYHIRRGVPFDEVVLVGTATSTVRWFAHGRGETVHAFAFYLPDADIDGDGLPEGAPVRVFTATTLDTRLALPR